MSLPEDAESGPWVTGPPSTSSVYHTDPECGVMKTSTKRARPASENTREFHDLEECPECRGEHAFGVAHSGPVPKWAPRTGGDAS